MFYDFSFLPCVLHAPAVLISSSWRYKVKGKIYEALCCVIFSLNSIPPRSKQLPNSCSAFPSSVLYPLVGRSKRPNVTHCDFAVRYVRVMAVFCLAVLIFRNIIGFIKKQRLNWLGHVERMAEDNNVQKIKRWKPMYKRPVGRPKTRWDNDVLEDIRNMNVHNWKKMAQNRDSWKKAIEQARTLYRL